MLKYKKFWGGTAISDKAGLTATEMFEALHDGRLKAIWIICTNPLTSLPNSRFVEEALKKAKYVVVQDISDKTESLAYADVILPAAAWTEKEGTMTNSERRISHLNKIIDPPGEALPDAEIICRFANKMGFKGFDYSGMEEIYKEHTRLTRRTNLNIEGLNYSLIDKHKTIQWPFNKKTNAGTSRLFSNKLFYTPSRKAIFHSYPTN